MFGFAVAIFLALGYWRYRVNRIPGLWTSEREAMYRFAMQHERDPRKLKEIADHFESDGFQDRANALRARAALASSSVTSQAAYDQVMRKALLSQNPDVVRAVAARYERSGRGASADLLRNYAEGVEARKSIVAGDRFGHGGLPGAGAQFGIGTIIPSTYVPPTPPPPPPPQENDETPKQ